MRILCADDSEIDRLIIRQHLRRSDLRAEFFEASAYAEALSLIQDQQFDCLLLDYNFPDGNGLDLLREIEAKDIQLPVIMLTGSGDERLAVELMKSGAMDYLPKTDITPLLLSRTIQAAVSRHQREQSRKAQFAAEKYARVLQAQKAELEQHARAIQESKQLLAASINALCEGYLLQDAHGTILRMNRSAEQILGLRADDCIGRADSFAGCHWVREDGSEIPSSDHPTTITLATGAPQTDVLIGLVRRDGRLVRLSIGCAPLCRPEESSPYATVTTFTDITNQHRAEAALAASNRRTQSVLESITDAFFALNRHWQFTYVNDQAELLLQRKREHLLGHVVWDDFPEAVGSTSDREYRRAVQEQTSVGFQDYFAPLDTWFDVRAYPNEDGLSVNFRDITAQKRAQELTGHLLRVSSALSGAVTTAEVAKVVLQAVLAIFHAEEGFLAQIKAEGDTSSLELVMSAGSQTSFSQTDVSTEVSPVLLSAVRNRRLIVRFPENQASEAPSSGRSTPQALLALPLLAGERVVGALGLRCPSERCEDTAQQTFLWTLAGQCALALERARLFDAAQARADRDPLTNLLNHRSFHKRLSDEVLRAAREQTSLAVVMLDLDNFRFFNDVYGHATGDEVLRYVAERLQAICRQEDVMSRFGGDEFALLLCDVGDLSPRQIETHILSAMDGMSYQSAAQDDAIPVRLSAGAAVFRHTDIEWHDVVKNADARLRRKKMGEEIDGEAQFVRSVALNDVEGFSMLDALVTAVDNKDHYTQRHSLDVMSHSLAIAREMGLSQEELRSISLGALLHDVGKIGVPDAILRKPGKLSIEEFEAIKQHPQMGAMIVATVPELESTLDAIRYHHERWDGHGYPEGLRGEQIPLIARIMAVADAYSAMTSDRPYRKGMNRDTALSLLERGTGTQWDPRCVAAFVRAVTPATVETL